MKYEKEEQLRLLAIAFYEELEFSDPYGVGAPMVDCKRPFGNSGYEVDILEIIGEDPEELDEDGNEDDFVYSDDQYKYARKLYTEDLTPYLKEHGAKYIKSISK
jgi:hypothetical protein